MSFRGTTQSALDIIRDLKDEVDLLKRQVGTTKQNTIRLGNWVLEAEADELVKMTNLITGAVSYVGANADINISGEGAYVEIPPFSFGGLLRNSFGTVLMRTNYYVMPVAFTVTETTATLVNISASGPRYTVYKNDVAAYTSPVLTDPETSASMSLSLDEGDTLYVEISDDGNGFNAGLSVHLRGHT